MIFFRDVYAKVWEIKPSDKYVDIRISTSEKDSKNEGKYINSNWFARCIGKAADEVRNMTAPCRIKMEMGKVTNETYTDKEGNKKTATRVIVMAASDADGNKTGKPANKAATSTSVPTAEIPETNTDEDYPF